MPIKRVSKAAIDKHISRIYSQRCSGIPISVMEISKVFVVGRNSIAAGDDDQTLGDKLFAFCQEIKL